MPLDRDTQWDEKNKAVQWVIMVFVFALLLLPLFMAIAMPITRLLYSFDPYAFAEIKQYFSSLIQTRGAHLLTVYSDWIRDLFSYPDSIPWLYWVPAFPFVLFPLIIMIGWHMNPYEFISLVKGSGHLATEADVKRMGLFDGFITVLGRFNGKFLKHKETLSTLACAPPGTGKSVGVVIPTILECDGVSMIVNDPKPELCYITSGYRATLGPVFIINWGMEDDPANGIFYPSWNPLAENALPPLGPERDMYVDSMVNVLVPDPEGSSADPHWTKTGRNALSGFIHFICSKCERAKAHDYFKYRLHTGSFDQEDARILDTYYTDMQDTAAAVALQSLRNGQLTAQSYVPIGTWDNLPMRWVGHEACIAMILDWITESQIKVAEDIKRRKQQGDQMAALADPMRELLEAGVTEARKFGYANRAILEFSQLAGTPDRERGSILSTSLTGVGIFKNAAVRARTSYSDFSFKDLRGMPDPHTGELKPVTVYLSVNQVDARALNVITGTFVQLMSDFLISNPPGHISRRGKVGPYPILFVLDEFPQMPKLNAVIDGPAVGRGQKVSYLLIGQDLGQISGTYGEESLETIMSTTAAKIILAQNNEKTAERFSEMIGNRTIEVQSYEYAPGILGSLFKIKKSTNTSLDEDSVIGKSTLMALPPDEQVVIMQGYVKNPIRAESPRYYKDKKMLAKTQIPPAPPVPSWLSLRRQTQQHATNTIQQTTLPSTAPAQPHTQPSQHSHTS